MEADKRFWNALIAVAVVLGGVWILASRVPESEAGAAGSLETAPRQGFLAPDFNLATLDGDVVHLSDLRGRPVLINFWATWCGPCRQEMPHLQAAFEDHAADGLVVLGVNQLEAPAPVARFVDEFGLTFPIPLDDDGRASEAFRVRGLPTSFFVDADGVVRDVFTGPMTGGLIESKLELILSDGG